MMSANVAEAMSLKVQVAGAGGRWFGTFWGPSGSPTPYYGRIPGPVEVRMSDEVALYLPEVKVIDSREDLVLLGTDLLAHHTGPGWVFRYVGYCEDGLGVITFGKGRATRKVELSYAPITSLLLPPPEIPPVFGVPDGAPPPDTAHATMTAPHPRGE